MPEYVHKPTRVRAEQYTGPGSLSPEFAPAICQPPCQVGGDRFEDGELVPHIDTIHGPVDLADGDYILPELLNPGRFYPCRRDEFDARYGVPAREILNAREAIARCVASVEDHPDADDYTVAEDVLLALDNAGLVVTARVQIPDAERPSP